MLKTLIGAVVGAKLSEKSPNVSSTGGAAGGALAATVIPAVIARLSFPAMLAIGAGAYLLSRRKTAASNDDATPANDQLPLPASQPMTFDAA